MLLTLIIITCISFFITVMMSSIVTTGPFSIFRIWISWSFIFPFIVIRRSMIAIVTLMITSLGAMTIPTTTVFLSVTKLVTYHTIINISHPLRVVVHHISHGLGNHGCYGRIGIYKHVIRLRAKLRMLLEGWRLVIEIWIMLKSLVMNNRRFIISWGSCPISPFQLKFFIK